MANFCLLPAEVDKFTEALKSGKIDPAKLSDMTSEQRRSFFKGIVGEDNAKGVNALFESKLLLKYQSKGFVTWAKNVAGMTVAAKRDMISRIERLDRVLNLTERGQFLEDLASQRLGIDVTQEEAKTISDMSREITATKTKWEAAAAKNPAWDKDSVKTRKQWFTNSDRLAYGWAKVSLENYVNDLKLKANKLSFFQHPIKKIKRAPVALASITKSLVASMDNSFFGRQGIKTLLDVRTSNIWFRNFMKSWKDLGQQLIAEGKIWTSGDEAVRDLVKADIYSRPNALNGKYDMGKYGLTALTEEAYPSSFPERIPLLGRLFKASEVAYNMGALRLRADLADRLIRIAEKQGINTLDKTQAVGMGNLVSSITGRGDVELTEKQAVAANALVFSIKFLRGNFNTLTAHQLDSKATKFTKQEAAKNLMSMVASVASIMSIVSLFNPDDIDRDPRSTNFGKIKIFGHWVDITGGMSSLVTLASRLAWTKHNGKWSFWTKSSSGKYTDLLSGEYGSRTAMDVFNDFWEGKLSPIAGIARDVWQGETFDGDRPSLTGEAKQVTTPLSVQSFNDMVKNPNSSNILGSMIIEGLGFSTNTYFPKTNWSKNPGKELQQFRDKIGQEEFQKANDRFNQEYNNWFNAIRTNEEWKKLPDEDKSSKITDIKDEIKQRIFREHNFKYERSYTPRSTPQESTSPSASPPNLYNAKPEERKVGLLPRLLGVESAEAKAPLGNGVFSRAKGELKEIKPKVRKTLSKARIASETKIVPIGSQPMGKIRNYPPTVSRWRSLAQKYFGKEADKALWVIQHESGGNPTILGDGGAAKGLFQNQHIPNGLSAEEQFKAALRLYRSRRASGGTGWEDWGENNNYHGRKFGALGNNPYPG